MLRSQIVSEFANSLGVSNINMSGPDGPSFYYAVGGISAKIFFSGKLKIRFNTFELAGLDSEILAAIKIAEQPLLHAASKLCDEVEGTPVGNGFTKGDGAESVWCYECADGQWILVSAEGHKINMEYQTILDMLR